MDVGESVVAVREVAEETRIRWRSRAWSVSTPIPRHVMVYHDGEVRQEFSVCFHARPLTDQLHMDGKATKAAKWIEISRIDIRL